MTVYILWKKHTSIIPYYENPRVIEGIYAKLEDAREQAIYYEEVENCETWIEEEMVYGAD